MSNSAVTEQAAVLKLFQTLATSVRSALSELDKAQQSKTFSKGDSATLENAIKTLAELTRLRDQCVATAPPHTQKTLDETVKSLTLDVNSVKAKTKPRTAFSFKKKPVTPEVLNVVTQPPPPSSNKAQETLSTSTSDHDPCNVIPDNPEPAFPTSSSGSIRRPSFSSIPFRISNQNDLHLSLPDTASTSLKAGTLLSLENCVINLYLPTADNSTAKTKQTVPTDEHAISTPQDSVSFNQVRNDSSLSTLHAKSISRSVLLLGRVHGAVHLTRLTRCTVVVSCRQFRMHESDDVDIHLWCGSDPIIENCSNVNFGPLPEAFTSGGERTEGGGRWREVKDFNWVGAGESPNWRALRDDEGVDEAMWCKIRDDEIARPEVLGLVKRQRMEQ
ncbi:hypothetical protein CAC42_1078 [Sphaceloma murrayae]|uniref:C-CAP/cofactor C-like domain-containing protein n=1 Tax=Sphaceloma murrayae TaxID=2082308 RepID=A0A2K1R1W6_9PEZI|nr:hypothetical protein CAC42_1078 [Sphaceloma murrayae]